MDIIINSSISPLSGEVGEMRNYYQNILNCLGYPSGQPPVADLLRRYHKLEGNWLIASPIYWQATHNDAILMACDESLDLPDVESRRWFAALTEFLKEDNVQLHYHDPYTWLIRFEDSPPFYAKPVHQLLQKSLMQQLHASDDTLFWTRFLTENQMFFSEHPLNKERVGRYPINGLWIWGEGELVERSARAFVCSDEAGCDLAALLTTHVSRYVVGSRFPKKAVLLFADFDKEQAKQFENRTVHWYWNNADYVTRPKTWLARLFAKN